MRLRFLGMKCRKIEKLITIVDNRNRNLMKYPTLGINKDKDFMPTVANMEGVDTSKYKIVQNCTFVFSGMQTGRDMCTRIALYDKKLPCIISPAYTTFIIKDVTEVLPEYFFMFFNREESDRYGAFLSDSSIRANLDWERFLDIEIPLPSIEEQEKVVNAWKALREIKEQNEAIAAPLMQMCQSYIQELKHEYEAVEIGGYIEICDEKNTKNHQLPVMGINIKKTFMPTAANTTNINLSSYKIIKKGRFVFSGMQTGRDMCIRTGLYSNDEEALVSPAYTTYTVKEEKGLLSQYLDILFRRKEMDRLGAFYSDASVRANLEWYRFLQIKIPLSPIEKQQAIVNIYNCANEAKKIAAEADRMSREACPALIQHVIHN